MIFSSPLLDLLPHPFVIIPVLRFCPRYVTCKSKEKFLAAARAFLDLENRTDKETDNAVHSLLEAGETVQAAELLYASGEKEKLETYAQSPSYHIDT